MVFIDNLTNGIIILTYYLLHFNKMRTSRPERTFLGIIERTGDVITPENAKRIVDEVSQLPSRRQGRVLEVALAFTRQAAQEHMTTITGTESSDVLENFVKEGKEIIGARNVFISARYKLAGM